MGTLIPEGGKRGNNSAFPDYLASSAKLIFNLVRSKESVRTLPHLRSPKTELCETLVTSFIHILFFPPTMEVSDWAWGIGVIC